MKKLIVLLFIGMLFNGCMVKKVFNGSHGKNGGGKHSQRR